MNLLLKEFLRTCFEINILSFLKGRRELDDMVYEVLEGVFGDCDAFGDDFSLISQNPEFCIDELTLRRNAIC